MVGLQNATALRYDETVDKIRRYEDSCGCEVGQVFAFVSLIAATAYLTFGPAQWSGWGTLGWIALWVIASSTIGKFLGLLLARIQVHRLRSALEHDSADGEDTKSKRVLPGGDSKEF